MPTTLENGVVIFNATPHPLHFICESGRIITADSDEVINAIPMSATIKETDAYSLNTIVFRPSVEGKEILERYREIAPEALVVGSIIAAQAFPEQIVAPVPAQKNRYDKSAGDRRIMRSDRFTTFELPASKKEVYSHGS